jgi:hypothetical protein
MSIHAVMVAGGLGIFSAATLFVVTRPSIPSMVASADIVVATDAPAPEPSPSLDLFGETWVKAALPLLLRNAEQARLFTAPPVSPQPQQEDSVKLAAARTDEPQTVRATVSARRHLNLCERNNMRRVWVSKKKWRCRK